MSQDSEPSILDYARFHGLAIDHLATDPRHQLPPCSENLSSSLEDPQDAPRLEAYANVPTDEKPQLSKEAAIFLASSIKPTECPDWGDLLPDLDRIRNTKLDLPLLKTDNELDMLEFGKRIEPDLANINLPVENIDEENDEGFTWPARYQDLPALCDAQVKAEKMDTAREVLLFIQAARRHDYSEDMYKSLLEEELHYTKRDFLTLEPVTPPLLPLDPEPTPFIPSSPAGHLELLSDHSCPTLVEHKKFEAAELENDSIRVADFVTEGGEKSQEEMLLDFAGFGPSESVPQSFMELDETPKPTRIRSHDLKIESPLTPPTTTRKELGDIKKASFSEMLAEFIPYLPAPEEEVEEFPTAFDDEYLADLATKASEKLEETLKHEKLEEADIMLRVDVPKLDFNLPKPPWEIWKDISKAQDLEQSKLDLAWALMTKIKQESSLTPFSIDRKDERKLDWKPFPRELAQVDVNETIEDEEADRYLSKILEEMQLSDVVDSSQLLWKPEGLRILDELDDSDEEELQRDVCEKEGEMDIFSALEDRKMKDQHLCDEVLNEPDLLDAEEGRDMLLRLEDHLNNVPSPTRRGFKHGNLPKSNLRKRTVGDLLRQSKNMRVPSKVLHTGFDTGFDVGFSAMDSLSNFMEIRAENVKKPKLMDSPYFPSPKSESHIQAPSSQANDQEAAEVFTTNEPAPSFPFPFQVSSSLPQTVIISKDLLNTYHGLIRRLETLDSSVIIIERDFSAHRTRSKTTVSSVVSEIMSEADLIISPTTAVIITTLQATTQLSLPGQGPSRSLVHERISGSRPHYECLFVLVSGPATTHELDSASCAALSSLTAFCASQKTAVTVLYIESGEETLINWILGLLSKYGFTQPDKEHDQIAFLQDETLWELFLRRAGMNAFAAQVVLGMLKIPDRPSRQGDGLNEIDMDERGSGGLEYGLYGFVVMGHDERVRRFGSVLGERILRSVGEKLDVNWGWSD